EAANRIREEVDQDANIIVGSTLDTSLDGMMRVSVVATGIDAAEVVQEMAVPRRKMSEPLPAKKIEQVVQAVAASANQRVETAYEEEQPSLLGDLENDLDFGEADTGLSLFDERMADVTSDDNGDLPPPVYQPQAQPAATIVDPYTANGDMSGFVAPKAPPAGKPSPEAMQRLQAAVNKAPKTRNEPAFSAPAEDKPEKTSRFGINSLINRMTGHGPEPTRREEPQRIHTRAANPEHDEGDLDQERIDIPAFLRRQAN
ncbi:MAG: cell division protein FtsZ, partial [Planctomycetota bacterium]